MNTRDGLYRDPAAIAPFKPSELSAELRELALEIVAAAARLGGALHPLTAQAIADFLRPKAAEKRINQHFPQKVIPFSHD